MVERSALPKTLSQKTAKALLIANGWAETLGGKHTVKMEKSGHRPITLPAHNRQEWGPQLTNAILKQAGLIGGEE